MSTRWALFCAAVLLVGPSVFSQEPTVDDVMQLRLDLVVQRQATLQARSDRLLVERQLLELDLRDWRQDQATLKAALDAHYACNYSLLERTCQGGVLPTDFPGPDPDREEDER